MCGRNQLANGKADSTVIEHRQIRPLFATHNQPEQAPSAATDCISSVAGIHMKTSRILSGLALALAFTAPAHAAVYFAAHQDDIVLLMGRNAQLDITSGSMATA